MTKKELIREIHKLTRDEQAERYRRVLERVYKLVNEPEPDFYLINMAIQAVLE